MQTNKIDWKTYPLQLEHDGHLLKGEIVYWSKDYHVKLNSPITAQSDNLHMMYMIPARFVTPLDQDDMKNVKNIDIVQESERKLKRIFEQTYYKTGE